MKIKSVFSLMLLGWLLLVLLFSSFVRAESPWPEKDQAVSNIVQQLKLNSEQEKRFVTELEKLLKKRASVFLKYGLNQDATFIEEKPSLEQLHELGVEIRVLSDSFRSELTPFLNEEQLSSWENIQRTIQKGMRERMLRQ